MENYITMIDGKEVLVDNSDVIEYFMEVYISLASYDSFDIEQMVKEVGMVPTTIHQQKNKNLLKYPSVAHSSASYKCYSDFSQEIETPVIKSIQQIEPQKHILDNVIKRYKLSASVLLEITVNNKPIYDLAFFLERETLEKLAWFNGGFSVLFE